MAGLDVTLRAALIDVARAGATVTYRDLAQRIGMPPPHRIHRLTLLLEDLLRADHAAGRPLLAALAVSRVGDGLPGRGFFVLLSELGRYRGPPSGAQARAAHVGELGRIYAYWGRQEQPETPMAKSHGFHATLQWTGAAQGATTDYRSYSRDYRVEIAGKPPLEGSADPAFRGDPRRHNPEDLLVAALSACHLLTYLALCARAGIGVAAYEDAASGTMALEGGGGRFTEVVLRPRVTLVAGSDAAEARRLHAVAHSDCFIAASVNFPVRNEPEIVVADGT